MLSAELFRGPAGLRLRGHAHDVWHVCAVLDGAFLERAGRKEIECRAGTARLSRPGATHDIEFDSQGGECLIVEAAGPFWNRVLARPLDTGAQHLFAGLSKASIAKLAAPALSADWVELLPLLMRPFGLDEAERAEMDEARQIIERDPNCNLSRLAASLGMDREDFAKRFRSRFGYRPVEYRTIARISKAVLRLKNTGQAPSQIALECGFSHQSHMINAFRMILGVTPLAVRGTGR